MFHLRLHLYCRFEEKKFAKEKKKPFKAFRTPRNNTNFLQQIAKTLSSCFYNKKIRWFEYSKLFMTSSKKLYVVVLTKVVFESPQVIFFKKFKEERLCWMEMHKYAKNVQTAT